MSALKPNPLRESLYAEGKADIDIARLEGCSRSSIFDWRRSRGLPSNGAPVAKKLDAAVEAQRQYQYDQGRTDIEISIATGQSTAIIQNWRYKRGLISKLHKARAPVEAKRKELYDEGLTDSEIGIETGQSGVTIKKWRARRKLEANKPTCIAAVAGFDSVWHEKRQNLYDQGLSDIEIGSLTGRSSFAIKKWRRKRGLKSNRQAPQIQRPLPGILFEFHAAGLSGAEIANRLGCAKSTVQRWLKKSGLIARNRSSKQYEELSAKRRAKVLAGWTDAQIAEHDGISISSVVSWRKYHKLASRRQREIERNDAERSGLHASGLTDAQIAEHIGASIRAIEAWRQRRGLAANKPHLIERRKLYVSGLSDSEIAQRQRVNIKTVASWRQSQRLIAHRAKRIEFVAPRHRDSLLRNIFQILPGWMAPDVADDAASEIYLAVLSGEFSEDEIAVKGRAKAKAFATAYANKFGALSLDETFEDFDTPWIERLRDERSSPWLEEMGATAW